MQNKFLNFPLLHVQGKNMGYVCRYIDSYSITRTTCVLCYAFFMRARAPSSYDLQSADHSVERQNSLFIFDIRFPKFFENS